MTFVKFVSNETSSILFRNLPCIFGSERHFHWGCRGYEEKWEREKYQIRLTEITLLTLFSLFKYKLSKIGIHTEMTKLFHYYEEE